MNELGGGGGVGELLVKKGPVSSATMCGDAMRFVIKESANITSILLQRSIYHLCVTGTWLVSVAWVADSARAGRLLDPGPYELEDCATGAIAVGALSNRCVDSSKHDMGAVLLLFLHCLVLSLTSKKGKREGSNRVG